MDRVEVKSDVPEIGENAELQPSGTPEMLRVTVSGVPEVHSTLIVKFVVLPLTTFLDDGEASTLKAATGGAPISIL